MSDHPVLTPDVIGAIARHMNDDHAADSLLIVQQLGGRADASAAKLRTLDGNGIVFDVTLPEGTAEVRVPWYEEITERGQVRLEVVRMYQDACARAGIAPRGEGEH